MFPYRQHTLLLAVFFLLLAAPAFGQRTSRRYALIVGVREYPLSEKLPHLAFAEPDADVLAAALRTQGYKVTVMTQTHAKTPNNQRYSPNADFIRKEFEGLVATPFLRDRDCILVIFAGHGIQLKSRSDARKTAFYFCPADAKIDELQHLEDVTDRHNLIKVDELYHTLEGAKAGLKLLVVDACRNDPTKPDTFRSANSLTRPPAPGPTRGAGFGDVIEDKKTTVKRFIGQVRDTICVRYER